VDYGHRSDYLECPVDVPCLILSHNSSVLSSDVQVTQKTGIEGEKLSTVDLFIKLSRFVSKEKNIFIIRRY
jgi:hypothetical protein